MVRETTSQTFGLAALGMIVVLVFVLVSANVASPRPCCAKPARAATHCLRPGLKKRSSPKKADGHGAALEA